MKLQCALATLWLCAAVAPARADETEASRARALAETFMKLVDANDASHAIDWTDKYLHDPKMDLVAHKKGFKEFLDSGGPLHGHVVAREQDIGGRYVRIDYLVIGEHTPLHIELVFYRPVKDWMLHSWSWYGDARQLFDSPTANK